MNLYSFMRFPGFKKKALTLSYDDGVIFDERLMAIMDANGLKGTFNINSELFAPEDKAPGTRRLSKSEAYKLYANSGHEIAIHGARHFSLGEYSSDTGANDILIDRLNLEKMFGKIIKGMAYANGSYNDDVCAMLNTCGVKYARTTITTEKFNIPTNWLKLETTCHHNNPRLMQLLDEFLEDKYAKSIFSTVNAPKLFYLWGHSYEFNDKNNWEVIEEFAKKAGNRDDVYYATNIELYEYIKAFERLEFSLDMKRVYNPSALDVYIDYYGEEGHKYVVPAGKEIELCLK